MNSAAPNSCRSAASTSAAVAADPGRHRPLANSPRLRPSARAGAATTNERRTPVDRSQPLITSSTSREQTRDREPSRVRRSGIISPERTITVPVDPTCRSARRRAPPTKPGPIPRGSFTPLRSTRGRIAGQMPTCVASAPNAATEVQLPVFYKKSRQPCTVPCTISDRSGTDDFSPVWTDGSLRERHDGSYPPQGWATT